MFWLGLIVSICFIPGYVGAIIPTQWAVLTVLLPLGLWRSGVFTPAHLAGLAFMAWSALSITWAPNTWDAFNGLWFLSLWALAFWFGTTVTDFRPLWQGLAVGLSVSSVVAMAQWFGYHPVLTVNGEKPAGLLFNPVVLGSCAALVIIALVSQRQWWYIPGVVPALILSGSRGAFLVLAMTLLTRWMRVRYILCAMALAAVVLVLSLDGLETDSDLTRLTIWGAALRELNLLGNGLGSFSTFFLLANRQLLYPGWVHNDYIQLWFEFGIGSIFILSLYWLVLRQRTSDHWPIFFAFALMGLFSFPLWTPIPTFMACMVAGAVLRDRHYDRLARVHGRYDSLPRAPLRQPVFPVLGRKALSTQPSD